MSDAYYASRLRYEGSRGVAKLHGRRVVLIARPALLDLVYVAIDYVPEIGMHQIMPLGHAWRDMTADEIRAADAVLAQVCGA